MCDNALIFIFATNGTIASDVLGHLNLNFHVQTFFNANIYETVIISRGKKHKTHAIFDICHQITPLMTLTYIFKVHNSKCLYLETVRASANKSVIWVLQRLIFAIEWHPCECCTPPPSYLIRKQTGDKISVLTPLQTATKDRLTV